jgi:putative transcriptional regulator
MTKRNVGNEIIKGMEEAIGYMRGKKMHVAARRVEIPDEINVRAIREKLKLSRQEFADRFGFSIRTLQHWEQGSRHPHGPARVLLLLLQREPTIIERILKHTKKERSKKTHHKDSA